MDKKDIKKIWRDCCAVSVLTDPRLAYIYRDSARSEKHIDCHVVMQQVKLKSVNDSGRTSEIDIDFDYMLFDSKEHNRVVHQESARVTINVHCTFHEFQSLLMRNDAHDFFLDDILDKVDEFTKN